MGFLDHMGYGRMNHTMGGFLIFNHLNRLVKKTIGFVAALCLVIELEYSNGKFNSLLDI